MQKYTEGEILKAGDSSHLIHRVEWADKKRARAQQGAASLVRDFLLWGTGGKCTLVQPPYGSATVWDRVP